MSLGDMYNRAETLADPIAISVASGQRETYELGGASAFRVVRSASSDGTLCFVGRVEAPGEEETTGYELPDTSPDSGWILADAVRFVRVYASGGAVAGQIWTTKVP